MFLAPSSEHSRCGNRFLRPFRYHSLLHLPFRVCGVKNLYGRVRSWSTDQRCDPDMLQERLLRDDLRWMTEQVFQDAKLFSGQLQWAGAFPGEASHRIEAQIPQTQYRLASPQISTEECPHPCQEFFPMERFHQIIIRSLVQAKDAMPGCATSSEDEHQHLRIARTDALTEFQPIQIREI